MRALVVVLSLLVCLSGCRTTSPFEPSFTPTPEQWAHHWPDMEWRVRYWLSTRDRPMAVLPAMEVVQDRIRWSFADVPTCETDGETYVKIGPGSWGYALMLESCMAHELGHIALRASNQPECWRAFEHPGETC